MTDRLSRQALWPSAQAIQLLPTPVEPASQCRVSGVEVRIFYPFHPRAGQMVQVEQQPSPTNCTTNCCGWIVTNAELRRNGPRGWPHLIAKTNVVKNLSYHPRFWQNKAKNLNDFNSRTWVNAVAC